MDALCFFDRINGDDIGVVKSGYRLCLSFKLCPTLGILGHLGRKDLQRHLAAELGVLGNVDFALPPEPSFSIVR